MAPSVGAVAKVAAAGTAVGTSRGGGIEPGGAKVQRRPMMMVWERYSSSTEAGVGIESLRSRPAVEKYR
jgi:hypothetical protein